MLKLPVSESLIALGSLLKLLHFYRSTLMIALRAMLVITLIVNVGAQIPVTGDLVAFPSGEVEFIVGPQLRSGSPRNIAPWFDENAISRGVRLGAEFPATPPPFDPASGDALDAYINLNYYDQALCQYTNYYRTGDARFLNAARKIADSWWSSHAIGHGRDLSFDNTLAPRNISLSGLMLRAMDGRPEMWPFITEYTRYFFQMWVGARVSYDGLYYGVRDGGYMLLYAADLARVHPDAAVRAEFRQKALNAAVNYYARLQYPDGSWRWDDPLTQFSQPFHIGLLLEGMIAVHRLTGDETVRLSILRSVENLYAYHFDRNTFTLHGEQGTWRAMVYWGYTDPYTGLPFAPGEQYRTNNPIEFNDVRDARQLNSTVHHAFGYAYFVSGDEKYRTWGDEIFRSSFNALDGYRGLADFRAKEYNENYRSSGRYLAWRLGNGAVPTPAPTPSPTPIPTPAPGKVTIKKQANARAESAGAVAFPYNATNLAAATFTLQPNNQFEDVNVTRYGAANAITVTEAQVYGWALTSISCVETPGGGPNLMNSSVDLANRRANIVVEPGEQVECTFTSEEVALTAEIGGRVLTRAGRGVSGAAVTVLDVGSGASKSTRTNTFGYYRFAGLLAGRLYTLTATTKRLPIVDNVRTFTLDGNLAFLNFYTTGK